MEPRARRYDSTYARTYVVVFGEASASCAFLCSCYCPPPPKADGARLAPVLLLRRNLVRQQARVFINGRTHPAACTTRGSASHGSLRATCPEHPASHSGNSDQRHPVSAFLVPLIRPRAKSLPSPYENEFVKINPRSLDLNFGWGQGKITDLDDRSPSIASVQP